MDRHQSRISGVAEIDSEADYLSSCSAVPEPQPPPILDAATSTGRLVIDKMVMENFKSYGCRKVLGPFHKNFTCVIGPNGSGKSNVIDAILFVFGFRSHRIRSKKLSSLIHKSEMLPNVDECSVEVHFKKIIDTGEGPDDYTIVPSSEFIITRKAYIDGGSSYFIDGARTQFRDVSQLLRENGIDLDHNRFLILQGEVEQIAMMKPKAPSEHEDGFLEYLEDIIGSARFKDPLSILAKRIERLSELRLEKLARVKVVEREKSELEGIRNEALEYLRLCNKITALKNRLWQLNEYRERLEELDLMKQHKEAQDQVEECKLSARELHLDHQKLAATLEAMNKQYNELQAKMQDYRQKFDAFSAEDARVSDDLTHIRQLGKKLTKQVQLEQKKLDEMAVFPATAGKKRDELTEELQKLEETKKVQEAAFKETMEALERECAPLKARIQDVESKLVPLKQVADEAHSAYMIVQQKHDLMLTARNRELKRADKAREDVDAARTELEAMEKRLVEAKQHSKPQNNLDKQISRSEKDLAEVKQREANLNKEIASLRSKCADAHSSLTQDTRSGNKVLNALMDACRSGELRGICGRLGDLGAIDRKYDVAISTACGALDNIVAETMDDAQAAVNFLKRYNLGQATFIGLDKMERLRGQCEASFQAPNNKCERLFDLIVPVDPRFCTAFYYALRDTLVADNFETARSTAFGNRGQRFRVVSLRGELVEVSGAISGGGGRCMSGRMCMDINTARRGCASVNMEEPAEDPAEVVAKLERELGRSQQELNAMVENRQRLEEVIVRLRRQASEAADVVRSCEAEMPRLKRAIELGEAELKDCERRAKEVAPSQAALTKSEAGVAKALKESEGKKSKAQKLIDEAEELKQQLLRQSEERVAESRSRIKTVTTRIKDVQAQINKLDVSLSSTERTTTKLRNRIDHLQKELEGARTRMAELEERQRELESTTRDLMAEHQGVKVEQSEIEKERATQSESLDQMTAKLNENRARQSELRVKAEDLKGKLQEVSQRRRNWLAKVRALSLHRLDENEDNSVLDEESLQHALVSICTASERGDNLDSSQLSVSSSVSKSTATQKVRRGPNGLRVYTDEELGALAMETESLRGDAQDIERMEKHVQTMAPNIAAIEAYRQKTQKYLSRVEELNQITEILTAQKEQSDQFRRKRLNEFLNGFTQITMRLKEMYRMITIGGDAELELIDSLDPFTEGVVFSVRPPLKSWKNISNLSGGEKTLSSLALVFALHHYRPTPLYVMDEIDAALDFKNVSIVANYLKERTKNAQFVIISLRNNMFELSDRLVGIFKVNNITYPIPVDQAYLDPNAMSRMIEEIKKDDPSSPKPPADSQHTQMSVST